MKPYNRREFLQLCLRGGVSLAALSSMQLQAMSGLVSQGAPAADFKALVCIFLYGGNDSLNMLLPLSGDPLASYLASRQNLAVTNSSPLSPLTPVDGGIGFNPSLAPLAPLFASQRLALVGGVGSLIAPLTLSQYKAGTAAIPGYLFSHNDQQATWMQGREKASLNYGWGGRLLEMLNAGDNYAANISLAGGNLWQTGPGTVPFSISKSGVSRINAFSGSSTHQLAFRQQLAQMFSEASHPLAASYSGKLTKAIDNTEAFNSAMEGAQELSVLFSQTPLSAQLQAVARTLSVQASLGAGRQVFFVGMGGFDTHDFQNNNHPALLQQLANGMVELDAALTALNLQQNVTCFTMSDFGRTLSSNGDGTDHGWAGNQLVMGGAVRGGEIYGTVLEQALGSPLDVGGGRMIPQVSNEQYFASLASWFGASDTELLDLFPSLGNFDSHTLGLFA